MNSIKILIVEDNENEVEIYKTTIKRYEIQHERKVIFEIAFSVEEAKQKIDGSFDGAIIDLKLSHKGNEGSEVIENVKSNFRVPLFIYTGTPDNVDEDLKDKLKIYTKGEVTLDPILDEISEIHKTGLTKIMGGRGVIEETMNDIFWNNIFPTIESWKVISKKRETESSLLRYVVNHLIELLDNDSECSFSAETYIFPPVSNHFKTGSILKDKKDGSSYIILSPACDMVKRCDGKIKTDRILIAQIQDYRNTEVKSAIKKINNPATKPEDKADAEVKINKIIRNNYSLYYHFLPFTKFYSGGVINFRRINTYTSEEVFSTFGEPIVQISNFFMKDVIARFSSYYSRQGQPDLDFEIVITDLIENF